MALTNDTLALQLQLNDLKRHAKHQTTNRVKGHPDTTISDPSAPSTLGQKETMEQMSQLMVECSVCRDSVHPRRAVRLACEDVYCKTCLKDFFMRVSGDESLFPPRCHGEPIDFSLVEPELDAKELATYQDAEAEFSSTRRVYCADPACAKFIPEARRTPDIGHCLACGVESCMHCKAVAHHGSACADDEVGQGLLQFAHEQGWQACNACGRVVSRESGCDHMTCQCGAEFCYKCGTKWKECECDDWEEDMLEERAEEIVDREAEFHLGPDARRRRVEAMAEHLRAHHVCTHRGKFAKIEIGRRGRVCEMCGVRHRKYMMSCRNCHLLVCEDCRRYRI